MEYNKLIKNLSEIGISDVFLKEKIRKSENVNVKRAACYLLEDNYSAIEIASLIGITRSTVIYHVNKAKELLSVNDKEIKNLIDKIKNKN